METSVTDTKASERITAGPLDILTTGPDLLNRKQTTGRKDDTGKAPMALVPPVLIEATARAFQNGLKYGQYNYMKGMEAGRILSALLRHVSRWNNGEELDTDSGVHHLGHAAACCGMLLHLQSEGRLVDDRWRLDGREAPEFSVYTPLATPTPAPASAPAEKNVTPLALRVGGKYLTRAGGHIVTITRALDRVADGTDYDFASDLIHNRATDYHARYMKDGKFLKWDKPHPNDLVSEVHSKSEEIGGAT